MAKKRKAKKAAKKKKKRRAGKKTAKRKSLGKPAKKAVKKRPARKASKRKKQAARRTAVKLATPSIGAVGSAPESSATPGARTALNPAAAWPFPTGSRP